MLHVLLYNLGAGHITWLQGISGSYAQDQHGQAQDQHGHGPGPGLGPEACWQTGGSSPKLSPGPAGMNRLVLKYSIISYSFP